MRWLLILSLFYTGDSAHTVVAEFRSPEACETARQTYTKAFNDAPAGFYKKPSRLGSVVSVCVSGGVP